MEKMKTLDIGAGIYPLKGADTLDSAECIKPTYLHDLNKFPYPIQDNSYDLIQASHVLEHLEDLEKVLKELHRILKPNGKLIIMVPYVSSNISFQDPTHKHFFTYYSFDYFVKNPAKHMEIWFTNQLFTMDSRELRFIKKGIRIYNYVIEKVANKFPIHYENLLKWIFPPRDLKIVLRKQKELREDEDES